MSAPLSECLEADALREKIYDRHGAGCCWHLVLEDGNVEDSNVHFCGGLAVNCTAQDDACSRLYKFMLAMSKTQRLKLHDGGYTGLRNP